MSRSAVDYSQGLPVHIGMGLIAALGEVAVPSEIVTLNPDETGKVRKWVEGPGPLKRSIGFMKSAFHQITEGRPDPAARLVISAAVLAGYGFKEDPDLAARIIETARRVVHHALSSKTAPVAGFGDEEYNTRPSYGTKGLFPHKAGEAMKFLVGANFAIRSGDYDKAYKLAHVSYKIANHLIDAYDDPLARDIANKAKDVVEQVSMARLKKLGRSVAGFSSPVDFFDSKGTMWGSDEGRIATLLGMLEQVRR